MPASITASSATTMLSVIRAYLSGGSRNAITSFSSSGGCGPRRFRAHPVRLYHITLSPSSGSAE